MNDPITAARDRGEAAVEAVCKVVGATEPERASMGEIEALVRHGYKFIDVVIRKDGVEHRFQLDWLARLFREMPSG